MEKLAEQVAVITGAGSGIGRAIAKKLAENGATVIVTDVSDESGQETVNQIVTEGKKAIFHHLDVTRLEQVTDVFNTIFERYGRIDILVNNAGIAGQPGSVEAMPVEEWKKVLDIHLNGSFYCLRTAAAYMKKRRYGRIVNMSSLAAETALIGFAHYAAAKHALIGLTQSAAKDLANNGITVNALKPGVISSALTAGILEQAEQRLAEATPIGTIGMPEDVANAAVFLVSPEAGFITGTSLIVDGGFNLVNEMDRVMGKMLNIG